MLCILYDKFGYRIYGLVLFSIILIISNILLLLIFPTLPLILLGVAYAIFAIILWFKLLLSIKFYFKIKDQLYQ